MTQLVNRRVGHASLRLTLDDPGSRNSLSEAMMAELQAGLDEAAADRAVRVVIIAANGPAFSSGHNLKEITARRSDSDQGAAYYALLMRRCSRLMLSLVHHPKPVIAQVQGMASAAGCQLVASCDLAVASSAAHFATPGVNIGLFCSTPMVALSRAIGRKPAMEMLLTGDRIDAEEARRIGLVNRVVSPNQLSQAVDELAGRIASKSLATVKTGKEAFYRQIEMPLEEAYAYAERVMVDNLMIRDSEEGIGAFLAKRAPAWGDK